MKKIILLFFLVLAAGGIIYFLFGDRVKYRNIDSFADCIRNSAPIMETFPRQCRAGGKTFTENIGNTVEKKDLIRVSLPRPNEILRSPLTVEGEARGFWYFEASFPVRLKDKNGNEIAVAVAQAQDDWMTTNFVPFKTVLTFDKPGTDEGYLVFEKDNPSGLPENADELSFPVLF